MNLVKLEKLEIRALILMHRYTAISSNRAIGMAFNRPERHAFSFLTIQCVGIKYFLVKFFGR